jgi:Glycosyl hydrolases family 16
MHAATRQRPAPPTRRPSSARTPGPTRLLVLAALSTLTWCLTPGAALAAAEHVTVRATADAEIQARAPYVRSGARKKMRVDAAPKRVGLVQFAVPRLQGPVARAILRLRVTSPSRRGPTVYATTAGWSDSHVTWKRQPASSGPALARGRPVRHGWVQYDVTSAVKGPGKVSFALVASSKDGLTVATRESRHGPRLSVTSQRAPVATGQALPQGGQPPAMPATPATPAQPSGPPFSDDFNGPAGAGPDPGKWVDYGPGCGGVGDWGKVVCGSNERLDGQGHLLIPATPSAGSGLMSLGRFGFVYGTMSAWIKIPSQSGYWPAFWSLNGTQTGSELTGEIDTTESYTTWPGSTSKAHGWNGGTHIWTVPDMVAGDKTDLSAGFHKYSANIAPGKVTYFLDDVEVGSITKASVPGPWAWGPDVMRPNFMILDLAVGGAGQSAPTGPATMIVDRVEVTTP